MINNSDRYVLKAVVNKHHISQLQQHVMKNCVNYFNTLNIFLVQQEYIKCKRICIILKVVKAILKIKQHLIISDFSAAACMFYKCNAIRAPNFVKLLPEAPVMQPDCPPIRKCEISVSIYAGKHGPHASADSCAFLSQLPCTLTFTSMKTLRGPQISAPQQA